jgi:hypothetical protein
MCLLKLFLTLTYIKNLYFWAVHGKEDDVFVNVIFFVYFLGPLEFHMSMCRIFRELRHIEYYSYFTLLVLCKYLLNLSLPASLVSSGLSEKIRFVVRV